MDHDRFKPASVKTGVPRFMSGLPLAQIIMVKVSIIADNMHVILNVIHCYENILRTFSPKKLFITFIIPIIYLLIPLVSVFVKR